MTRGLAGPTAALLFCFLWMAAAAAQTAGTDPRPIVIVTEPGAAVWINGVRFGTAGEDGRLRIARPPAGRKTVRVRADGFRESSKPLAATPPAELSVQLVKSTDEAELLFQKAEQLAGIDRDKAIETYEAALKLRPKFIDARIGLARVLLDAGDHGNAEKALKDARLLGPVNPEISAIEGRFLKGVGESEKAIAAFKRALREGGGYQPEALTGLGLLFKDRAEAYGASGEFQKEAANYAEAAKYLSQALKQLSGAPDSVVLYQTLGLIYETQDKNEEAIALYQEFLRSFPGHPEAAAFESYIVQLRKN